MFKIKLLSNNVNDILLLHILENREKDSLNTNYYFGLVSAMISIFRPCHCNKRLSIKESIFDQLNEYVKEYTHVIKIVNTSHELEKLKYCLFTDHELAFLI